MREHEASRTLVKSPPELWSECSDAASLARHLGEFAGEIRITRLEPETTVAWEGEHASGTVRIEPSGWGTRVTLTIEPETAAPAQPAAPVEPVQPAARVEPAAPEPVAPVLPAPKLELGPPAPVRRGALAWLKTFFLGEIEEPVEPAPDPVASREPLVDEASSAVTAALDGALDSLGQAHHRPYSRA
jgi:hypothetical protein